MESKKNESKPPKRPADDPNLSAGIEDATEGEHGVAEMGGQGMSKAGKEKKS